MGRRLYQGEAQLVADVRAYFDWEKQNGAAKDGLDDVAKRTCEACRIDEDALHKVTKQGCQAFRSYEACCDEPLKIVDVRPEHMALLRQCIASMVLHRLPITADGVFHFLTHPAAIVPNLTSELVIAHTQSEHRSSSLGEPV